MWHKFKKVKTKGNLPPARNRKSLKKITCHYATLYDGTNSGRAVPMIGVLPSGQIVDDFKSPECEPYFIITFNDDWTFDVVTDGEKYSWIHNEDENSTCHFVGQECVLAERPAGHEKLTTYDALLIKALIKVYVNSCGSS